MGILSDIFHKIFPASHPAAKQGGAAQAPAKPQGAPAPGAAAQAPAPAPAAPAPAAPGAATAAAVVDVAAILDQKVQGAGQALNWRTSIVDLLKLLQLDSSLDARKELARELHYSGDTGDSAAMNIWLHKQVMAKLAANGGKVPADLAS